MIGQIKNNEQYEAVLENIYALMQKDISVNSKESEELEVLSILVKDYEQLHFSIRQLY